MTSQTKIFLDSGDPKDTDEVLSVLGRLDGQTTNPSLIAKSTEATARKESGERFTNQELLDLYRRIVQDISKKIPEGSVSIETYADEQTTAEKMIIQAREMNQWIPNAHIKLPTISEGLKAGRQAVSEGIRINMTLVFSQAQAAAVYSATRGAKPGDVFLSPFIGRLDDLNINGLDLIKNIMKMYQQSDGHVQVLAASIRHPYHVQKLVDMGVDIMTVPKKVLLDWHRDSSVDKESDQDKKTAIPYDNFNIGDDWQSFDIRHELTDQGLKKFVQDWNDLINY
ncbi:MAG: transaldolase family protein [bacterium]